MSLLRRIWSSLISCLTRRELKWMAVFVGDEPVKLKHHRVYLVMEDDEVWQATFTCPCGCQMKIQLCCLPESRPSWSYKVHADKTVTLHPSIWRKRGCCSHFFLRWGIIKWCR